MRNDLPDSKIGEDKVACLGCRVAITDCLIIASLPSDRGWIYITSSALLLSSDLPSNSLKSHTKAFKDLVDSSRLVSLSQKVMCQKTIKEVVGS